MSGQAPRRRPPGVVFWFRNDLRLHDQLALNEAIRRADELGGWLLPVFVHAPGQRAETRWGFARTAEHRLAWVQQTLADLAERLAARGSALLQFDGDQATVLRELVDRLGGPLLVCEEIAAPQEQAVVLELRRAGVQLQCVWQSTLVDPRDLPFDPAQVADIFTSFRQAIERAGVKAREPVPEPQRLPPLPSKEALGAPDFPQACSSSDAASRLALPVEERSSFPCHRPGFAAGERGALAHLREYCERGLPHSYKASRNGLSGPDYSSKWSPWLAVGALSPRQAWGAIRRFEAEKGANEGTYWLWFELLWRDHFRWLHLKHGTRLYRAGGLPGLAPPRHDPDAFGLWCAGRTGNRFIDAGMRELAATGYLSNRLRQNVASYLIHDLGCDWRAGAAWFEAQLLDYDVFSNQGNWLYLSGRGTDPRGSRRFDPDRQAQMYDRDGAYQRTWAGEP